jgi:hypothetical protein
MVQTLSKMQSNRIGYIFWMYFTIPILICIEKGHKIMLRIATLG